MSNSKNLKKKLNRNTKFPNRKLKLCIKKILKNQLNLKLLIWKIKI